MKGYNSHDPWGDNLFINGKPYVRSLQSAFSESELAILQKSEILFIIEGWYSFHSCGDGPLINGNHEFDPWKVTFPKANLLPEENFKNCYY